MNQTQSAQGKILTAGIVLSVIAGILFMQMDSISSGLMAAGAGLIITGLLLMAVQKRNPKTDQSESKKSETAEKPEKPEKPEEAEQPEDKTQTHQDS